MAKLRNQLTRQTPQYEENSSIGETVPDQGLTVREILVRYGNNTLGNTHFREPIYNEDLPDMRFMEITEQTQLYKSVQEEIEEKQEHLKHLNEQNEIKKRGRPKKAESVVEDETEDKTE